MKIPKTPIAFDYDLWTTEDGKCMVRVKRTGEVSEVDRKVMRILRAEEKRIRRSYGSDNTSEDEDGAEKISDTVLSLDAMPEDDVKSAAWLADSRDCMEELITALKEKELLSILTEKQRELYLAMTREGKASASELHLTSKQRCRKNFIKFFERYSTNGKKMSVVK